MFIPEIIPTEGLRKYAQNHLVLMKVNVKLQIKSIRTRQRHQLRSLKNQIFKGRGEQKVCIATSFKTYLYYADFWVGLSESQ